MKKNIGTYINKTYLWLFFYGLLCCITSEGSAGDRKITFQHTSCSLDMETYDKLTVWFKHEDGYGNPSLSFADTNGNWACKVHLTGLSKQEWHKVDVEKVKQDRLSLGHIESLKDWKCEIPYSRDLGFRITATGNILLATTDPHLLEPAERMLTDALVSVAVILVISLCVNGYACFRLCRAQPCTHQRDAVQSPREMALEDMSKENGSRNVTNSQEPEHIYEEIDDQFLSQVNQEGNTGPELPPPRQISAHSSENSLYSTMLS